ncbi:MAG: hypothetical protein A3C13_01360 [Candidatus Lloydbacteria bacterium RIFCSPHIGHO2_02_FULL_50_11]|nr:MAG: hypothetical protein A3C13_01360 [Candidatus Lloydbacteria bacterium RIFCSPHIGHO2_02_FULL_50_11]
MKYFIFERIFFTGIHYHLITLFYNERAQKKDHHSYFFRISLRPFLNSLYFSFVADYTHFTWNF